MDNEAAFFYDWETELKQLIAVGLESAWTVGVHVE